MPVFHWTQHAYGTWLPDREQGHYRHHRGLHPPNKKRAGLYRKLQRHAAVEFSGTVQQIIVAVLLDAARVQCVRLHGIATDSTHFHAIVSWRDENREAMQVGRGLRTSLSRALNDQIERRTWFTRRSDWARVGTPSHFWHLLDVYLPEHRGVLWFEDDPPDGVN